MVMPPGAELMSIDSLVSIVIPTIHRPVVVLRAIRSVLNQTYRNFEIIVLIDGPDEATNSVLATIAEPRLRVVTLAEGVGAAQIRNLGVSYALGKWVAFLDDDDEWLPDKLEVQVEAAMRLGGERILLASHYLDKGASFERVLPERKIRHGEALSEFMFCRRGLMSRVGRLQTSTYFVSRRLAQEVPFRPEVRPQEDFDWLLRSAARTDMPFELLPELLSIYHNEQTVDREGATGDFDFFWTYAHRNRALFTPKAFSSYLASYCGPAVSLSSRPLARWSQVYRGMKTGKVNLRTLIFAAIYAVVPMERRRRLRLLVSRPLNER